MNCNSFRLWGAAVICLLITVFLCGCGYSREEKKRMEEIAELGRENAVSYVKEKYGFIPEIKEIQVCMESKDQDPLPWANGYVLAVMSYENETFRVHINGEKSDQNGRDDYQYKLIIEEAREYFKILLGYEIYDIYLQYQEESSLENVIPDCHGDNLIRERYEPGNFEKLLQRYPVNIRIDDCINQDLTNLKEKNSAAAKFLEKCARDYKTRTILISYRSVEDYNKGYRHTYGRGEGHLDFEIYQDGLYISSYGVFDEEDSGTNRFELQEYDGMIFSCLDSKSGNDLTISDSRDEWLDLGETGDKVFSKVYSVDKDGPGETVVYLPVEQYGRNASIFIQHFYENKWWQHKAHLYLTKDKQYLFLTFHGIPNGSFDFVVD